MWVIPIESNQKESGHFTLKPYDNPCYLIACKPPNKVTIGAVVHEEKKGKANTFKCNH